MDLMFVVVLQARGPITCHGWRNGGGAVCHSGLSIPLSF